eukprot:347701-Chlamydomonas_euryale.AAC.10
MQILDLRCIMLHRPFPGVFNDAAEVECHRSHLFHLQHCLMHLLNKAPGPYSTCDAEQGRVLQTTSDLHWQMHSFVHRYGPHT